jgi:hypothetical protein
MLNTEAYLTIVITYLTNVIYNCKTFYSAGPDRKIMIYRFNFTSICFKDKIVLF